MSDPIEFPKLSKGDLSQSFDVITFVGNGAIANGSGPLERTLLQLIEPSTLPEEIKKLQARSSETYHQLAVISYKFRVIKAVFYSTFFKDPGKCVEEDIKEFIKQHRLLSTFLKIREELSDQFNDASDLSLRRDDEIDKLVHKDSLVVTTNWDNSLWNSDSIDNCLYIHGRAGWPDSLILPTELFVEDTTFDFSEEVMDKIVKFKSGNLLSFIFMVFRYGPMEPLLKISQDLQHRLEVANKMVVWGYSLADYDADVNALIGMWDGNAGDRELVVINPDKNVLSRAMALTGCLNAKLYNPLTQKYES